MNKIIIDKQNPSSILICDKDKSNQKRMAENVISQIFEEEIKEIESFYDPDLVLISPEKSSIQGISISDIHALISRIKFKAYERKYKVGLILHADEMTTEAQNSILKTLEEPPSDTFIVMTCNHKNNLLPTIISRTKIFEFFNKQEHTSNYNFEKIVEYDLIQRNEIIEQILKNKDKSLRSIQISDLIKSLINYYRNKLLSSSPKERDNLIATIDFIKGIEIGIKKNVNLKLALLNLITNLPFEE